MARTKQCASKSKNKKIGHSDSTKFEKSGNRAEHVGTEHGEHQINNDKHEKLRVKTNNKLIPLLQVTFKACESLVSVIRAFKQNNVPIEIAQEALLFILKTYFFKESKFEGVQANTRGAAIINFSVPPYVINNYTLSDSLQETIEESVIKLNSYEFESQHKKFYKHFTVIANLLDNGFNDNSSVSFGFHHSDMGKKPLAGLIYFPFNKPNDFIMAAPRDNFLKASFSLHLPSQSAPRKDSVAEKALLSRDSYGTPFRDVLEKNSYTIEDLDSSNGDVTSVQTTLAERFVLLLQGRGSFLVDCRPAISLFGKLAFFLSFELSVCN
jgi:hypothetical protein